MKIYFLRHATAVDEAATDELRELTPEGMDEARRAGRALNKLRIKPHHIISSPLVRAWQTAEMAAESMRFKKQIIRSDAMKNGVSTDALLRVLRRKGKDAEIVIVGHSPSMIIHLAALIGSGGEDRIALSKGGMACVDLPNGAGIGRLKWLLRKPHINAIASL
jgi:phosphohistidine phosphatase